MLTLRKPDARVVLHGHFYQPPRESPWTDEIPEQPSAHPYHDWNERIHRECYRPNTVSRVLDGYGRIRRIVNNFEQLSFNVGPTLLSWLESTHADTYARILDADRRSRARRRGHGNAIAQAYHHMILPLANPRDRRTQVLWGLRDFALRFGRQAEGMWLPETAIHADTVEVLVQCGVRFTVLSPFQARRVRSRAGGPWHEVSGGRVDPRQPYVVRAPGGGELVVFFYDGPVSQSMAFEKLLHSADRLAERLALVVDPERSGPQLVSVAVDGETFGHHQPFADMCVASFCSDKAAVRGFRLTNYAELLDDLEPTHEVELESGDGGEGTAWSCAHGVGRWWRDCGCSTGAQPGWNQAWRQPLRQALDGLRDGVAALFERHGAALLHDPWAARDDYVEVADRHDASARLDAFLSRHLRPGLGEEQQIAARTLLEAQRHAMAMYTSCAWFFADVSGIETIQNLRYAARCIELMREISALDLEGPFLAALSRVPSNLSGENAAGFYERWVRPDVRTAEHAVTSRALLGALDLGRGRRRFYGFDVVSADESPVVLAGHGGRRGHLQLVERRTGRVREYAYVALQYAPRLLACFAAPAGAARHEQLGRELLRLKSDLTRLELERILAGLYGATMRGISDLLPAERHHIAATMAGERVAAVRVHARAVFDESLELLRDFAEIGLDLPEELRQACELSVQADVLAAATSLRPPYGDEATQRLRDALRLAHELRLHVRLEPVTRIASEHLLEQTRRLGARPDRFAFTAAGNLLGLAETLQLPLDRTESEEQVHTLVENLLAALAAPSPEIPEAAMLDAALDLAARLNFAVDELRWRLQVPGGGAVPQN